jgi:hypothetical protein
MTTYSCSLHFGAIEIEGIEATNVPKELSGKSIEELLLYYVQFLNDMINDATKEFG